MTALTASKGPVSSGTPRRAGPNRRVTAGRRRPRATRTPDSPRRVTVRATRTSAAAYREGHHRRLARARAGGPRPVGRPGRRAARLPCSRDLGRKDGPRLPAAPGSAAAMTLGRSIASCTTLGSFSASANSRNDSSITTRSRSAMASMNCTTACLCRAAVGVVRVADDGDAGAARPDELGVLREVQGEAAGLLEREHVDPLAGLHGWSVQRPKVGTGTASDSRTSRWSIQVISSVDPCPSPRTAAAAGAGCTARR
ncbi:hypothetical protein STENM223S_05361 [Streptomyces tendae]